MAQVTYRANLSAKTFPFLSQNWGRTVIVPQYDNTFSRQLTSQEDPDKDVGIPQIYYCHNVMPHSQGFQSVGYKTRKSGGIVSGSLTSLSQMTFIPGATPGLGVYLASAGDGDLWALRETGTWFKLLNYVLSSGTIYTARVNGITYIRYKGQDYTYNFGANTLTAVVYTGLAVSSAAGIVAAAGYLIVWDGTTIYWSSTVDPTDFVPSLVSGAGSLTLEAATSNIVICVPHNLGFIIYTGTNAIAAVYTGNARYPFQFRDIVGTDGIASSSSYVTQDSNTPNQYAYTKSGFQIVSTTQAQTTFPELTDFISGKLYEIYDETTETFTTTQFDKDFYLKLTHVADRYLIISYTPYTVEIPATQTFTHALVYDITSNRWGKLKIDHTDIFQYRFEDTTVGPRDTIGVLLSDGTIKTVDFDPEAANSSGVIMLGKYQFVRPRLLQLDEINLENIQDGGTFSIYDLAALDGKNGTKSVPSLLESSGLYRKYGSRAIGVNHSLVLTGAFLLTSVVLSFNIHGKR